MLLVYSHRVSPRLRFAFGHIIKRILGLQVNFTTEVDEFLAHPGPKMSYTHQPFGDEFFVHSHRLLFEQGISDLDIHVQNWEDTVCFFSRGEVSDLPFDIFAAAFYLLSRYEEYQPHVPDAFGRFSYRSSLAFQHNFLDQPVVDIWAYKFREVLQKRFPELQFPKRVFQVQPIIYVPLAYHFNHQVSMRTINGILNDLIQFRFNLLYTRLLVLLDFRKDPFDSYNYLINKQKQFKRRFIFTFLVGKYSTYDNNLSLNKKAFVTLIKSIADYSLVGIKNSYLNLSSLVDLKRDKERLEAVTNRPVIGSRNSYNKLNLPNSYRHLIELEIHRDFSMGYHDAIGFRAGTCTPLLFYDMDFEIQTPLELHSFHVMDASLLKYRSLLDKQQQLEVLVQTVRRVNGTLGFLFHNYTFGKSETWNGFRTLFTDFLNSELDLPSASNS